MYFSASELLEVHGRGAALRALVGGVADHGVAADGAHANRLDAEFLLALHALERAVVDALVVHLGLERVADRRLRALILLELGDGVVGGVHLVDLEGLAAPGRLEVVGRGRDLAEHARNHLSVLGKIATTTDNLKAAWGGETFEIDEMYPAYNAVAKLQENKSAQTTIRYALKAEMDHQGIYDSTLKGVEGKKDLGVESVRVCPICGHTVIGDAPDECPQCGTAAVYFKEF